MKPAFLSIVMLMSDPAWAFQQGFLAPKPGSWRSFTDMKNVNAVSVSGSVLWAGTSGGVFGWDRQAGSLIRFTNANGLASNDITALMIDGNLRLWVGTSDGSVQVLEPRSNDWKTINDIMESGRIQKAIRTFAMSGDSLFIGSDFGVSVFRLERWEFGDTYGNFGFAGPASVRGIEVNSGQLWVATNQGLASAPRFATNLSSPTAWTRYGMAQGLPSGVCTSLSMFRDTVVVGTTAGAAFFNGSSFQRIDPVDSNPVVATLSTPSGLFILRRTGGYSLSVLSAVAGASIPVSSHASATPTSLAIEGDSSTWFVGTQSGGVDVTGSITATVIPNGPQANLISSLGVDETGVLWCASGINGKGFYRFNPAFPDTQQWKNFTVSAYPFLKSDNYYKVSIGSPGRVWISSWGTGVIEVVADSIRRRIDAASVPSLAASVPVVPPSEPFVVVGSVASDANNQEWFANRTAVTGNYLAHLVNDSTFSYQGNVVSPGQGLFTSMVIDREGSLWLGNSEPSNKGTSGLYYFNKDLQISGTSLAGGWGFMTESDGLPNNSILSLVIDLDGNICVGTDLGVMIISEPRFPKQRHFSSFPLREQSIQALAIDAVNNKWVGTKEGVFVMNADATQILQQHTVSSTGGKLLDNDIRALAIDQQRGVVYIGTEKGLSALEIDAVETVRTIGMLRMSPNPFIVPAENRMVIAGLVSESSIKILSVDGSLVSEFKAQGGGRAFWDGKNKRGGVVPSGIYFIVAFAENGDQIGTGKVAVIRR